MNDQELFRLSKKERFTYSLMQMPNTILGGIFSFLFVDQFWDNLQMDQTLFVIAQILYAVVNSLNDFYFGRISDNTDAKRWGSRRLIYIKWGGPLWSLVFFLTWFPWSYTNQWIIFFNFLTIMFSFDSLLSLVWIVWLALMSELTENHEERNRMGLYNAYFNILGAVFVVIAFLLFQAPNGLLLFRIFAGFCSVLCAICYIYVGTHLKERPELYVNQEHLPLFKSLSEVLKSRSYITMTVFRVFNQLNGALSTAFAFTFLYWLGDIYILIAFLTPIVSILGSWVYKSLSGKYDVKILVIWGRTLQILLSIATFFILYIPGTEFIIWGVVFLNGIFGGYMIFDVPIMSMVMDEDEVFHNKRREGLILGTNAFFNKIAESSAPILGTYILLLFGFIQGETPSTDAILGIKFLFLIIPAIVNFIALLGIAFFPLYGKNLEKLQKQLNELHTEKKRVYDSSKDTGDIERTNKL
ncbi:MAG: MFS transporter [Candidatus Lokiarchaeota archaeon]|nr:MFS transporter [Candidatus Lokiarchaeota archaeon]